jgi:hypothetical protein
MLYPPELRAREASLQSLTYAGCLTDLGESALFIGIVPEGQ